MQLRPNDCHFCTDLLVIETVLEGNAFQNVKSISNVGKTNQIVATMQHSLYLKYASSQNYYYTKELNEIMAVQRTTATIRHRDMVCYDDSNEECLNRYYNGIECQEKLQMLGEYYKFHNEIPRMFMLPAIVTLNWFHDRKRRLEYFRIARMIEDENKNNPDKPPKGIVGDSPLLVRESENLTEQNNESSSDLVESKVKKGRILDELSWTRTEVPPQEQSTQKANIKQQIQHLKVVFQERLASAQEETKKPAPSWKKNLKLDEKALRQYEDMQNNTARNHSSRINHPSDRVIPQTATHLRQNTRPSLRNILSIIKNTPTNHGRKGSKFSKLKADVDLILSQDSLINTPRQLINVPFSVKEKKRMLIQQSNTLTQSSKQSIDIKAKPSPTQMTITRAQPQPPSFVGNITPRNQLLQSPLSKTTQRTGFPSRSKVQMLELKVLTDIQQLQNRRIPSAKEKKHCTLQLDTLSRNMDPRSLTQRVLTSQQTDFNSLRLKSIYQRKKIDSKQFHPSGAQSQRDKLGKLEIPQQPKTTKFIPHYNLNYSSSSPKAAAHAKSNSFNKKINLDSQLFKAAVNLAQRIQNAVSSQPNHSSTSLFRTKLSIGDPPSKTKRPK